MPPQVGAVVSRYGHHDIFNRLNWRCFPTFGFVSTFYEPAGSLLHDILNDVLFLTSPGRESK